MRFHGGILNHQEQLDFSANINPLGMPKSVKAAAVNAIEHCIHYPDPYCRKLIDKLAQYENAEPANIVCGNGADDLIYRIVSAFSPRKAMIVSPCFSEYRFALEESGCLVEEYYLDSECGFRLHFDFLNCLRDDLDIIFLCSPNNPTGCLIEPYLLREIAEFCRKCDILLVCDECFMPFCEDAEKYSLKQFLNENCIILKAFTKIFAMPGLRLGYAVCGSEAAAQKLRDSGQFWSVSVPAQAAGIAALNESGWIRKTVEYAAAERTFLTENLRKCGCFVYDGKANFLLIKAPVFLADELEKRGIIIRRCVDFHGLSNEHFRIAVRTHEDNIRLICAVREVLGT